MVTIARRPPRSRVSAGSPATGWTISEEPTLYKEDGVAQLRWLRMGCAEFDLYADVSPPELGSEPVIGVFVERLNREHLQDLYENSCARYVFSAWLTRALEAIAKDAG